MSSPRSMDDRKAITGAAILGTGAALFTLFFLGIIPKLVSGGGRTVRANFASTGSLHKGEPVRIDGVTIGKVKDVSVNSGGAGATVEMTLDKDAGPLYANARASIKWRTLLGASFAVALQRGTPGLGELGSQVIPERRTSFQVELDDITGALTAPARRGLQQTFHELPDALSDPSQPGRLLKVLAQRAPAIADGLDAVRGQRPDSDIGDLVTNTGQALRALNAPQQHLRSLVQDAASTTATTAARAQDIADTITVGADTLPAVRSTLTRLNATIALADPLLVKLKRPAGDVAATLSQLHPVVSNADRLLSAKAQPLLRSLRPTARSLAQTARSGVPLLDELQPSLDRIDKDILPDLATRSPESKRTTYEMIGPALAGLDGIGSHYDAQSSYIRFTGNGGSRIVDDLPCRAFFTDPGAAAFLQCQAFGDAFRAIFGGPARNRLGKRP